MSGHSGRCACGAVRYEVRGPLRDVWNCHCPRCRRITGHHMAATAAARDDVHVEDASALTWWSPDGAVGYGLCRICGSTLFWRSDPAAAQVSIGAGTLDPPTGLHTTRAWWCAEASDYHDHPAGLLLVDHED